ncbi:hypothetical protein VPH35_021436 [Triticum aestivum]
MPSLPAIIFILLAACLLESHGFPRCRFWRSAMAFLVPSHSPPPPRHPPLSLSLFLAHCQEAAGGGTRPGRPPLDEEPRKNPPTTPAPPPLHLRPRVATYGQRTKLEHTRQMGLAVSRGATVTSMGRAMVRYESAPKMTVSTQKSLPR